MMWYKSFESTYVIGRAAKVVSSSVESDPKDSQSFLFYEEKSFSKTLYKYLYENETEIVTF